MKKKRNKIVVMLCIICCIIGGYKLYPRIFKEKGNLYSLKMSKNYKDSNYDIMQVSRNRSMDVKEQNVEIYKNCKKESKKILDYLNRFNLKETSSKEDLKNTNEKNILFYIGFHQSSNEYKKNSNNSKMLRIIFNNDSSIEINTSDKNNVSKNYKITEGNIDFNYINKILNGAKKKKELSY